MASEQQMRDIENFDEMRHFDEDKIMEAFANSEKSYDEYVDRFSGEVPLTKDGYVEWLQRITIDDVPQDFIDGFTTKKLK